MSRFILFQEMYFVGSYALSFVFYGTLFTVDCKEFPTDVSSTRRFIVAHSKDK